MSQYDVVVIGGGAAGLFAALVLSRARRTVLVVDAGAPRNAPAAHLHGYLARDGIPPAERLTAGRYEGKSYGGEIIDGAVTDLVPDPRPPSPSTPTSSRTTCATPSAASNTTYCPDPPPAPTRRSHHDQPTAQPEPRRELPARRGRAADQLHRLRRHLLTSIASN